jgi:hypothetical protein
MRQAILPAILGILLRSAIAVAEPADTEPNDDPSTAQPITLAGGVNGSLYPGSDIDWFSFSGQAGAGITIELFHVGDFLGTTDFILDLYGPGPTLLASSNTYLSGNIDYERIDYMPATTGTHYIRVSPWSYSPIANSYAINRAWISIPTPTPGATMTPTPTFTPWIPNAGVEDGVWEVYR